MVSWEREGVWVGVEAEVEGAGGRVVYWIMDGCRSQSPTVSCVRKDMPA